MLPLEIRRSSALSLLVLALACGRGERLAAAPIQEPVTTPPPAPEPTPPPPELPVADPRLREITEQVYTFAYPLVLMDVTRQVMTSQAPTNTFWHQRALPDPSARDVVSPNPDTLFSSAWLDLAEEPIILSVPDMGKRYWLMPLLDGWTEVFASPGTRTTGNRAQNLAIVGPNWQGELPPDVIEVRAPTNMVWALGRLATTGKVDTLAVHKLQDGLRLTPLSSWGPSPITPEPPPPTTGVDTTIPPTAQVDAMPPEQFLARLADLLVDNPPAEADAAIVARLHDLGITAGAPFDADRLEPAAALALREGVGNARLGLLAAAREPLGDQVHGWRIIDDTGQYGVDYERRAVVARVGLGANLPQDAIYPTTSIDGDGLPLTGAQRYVLHFNKNQLPPVEGFWSLSLYDADLFFVDNPLGRHTLGDRSKLKRNRDGSVDIYLQQESPGKAREANWLPAPPGEFNLVLRLYWPKDAALNGSWAPPPVKRVEGAR